MDLSTSGDLTAIRAAILSQCPVAVGTVLFTKWRSTRETIKSRSSKSPTTKCSASSKTIANRGLIPYASLRRHLQSVARFMESQRLGGRSAGAGRSSWNGFTITKGKPLYVQYDGCSRYSPLRRRGEPRRRFPSRRAQRRFRQVQIEELVILGELVKRARNKNVGVFVKGPAHAA